MKKELQQYFPMIRTRRDVLKEIQGNLSLSQTFNRWEKERQEVFLDFCTGVRGVKLLYDSFFKEVINPEFAPQRLESLLSQILKQKVTIKKILPGDSSRIADENSLLIMDILVELEDGELVNVEVQKIGYMFPGARSACYSADLLLRQYKRVKNEKQERFHYNDIKGVYTIVLFEKSPQGFHEFPDDYVHFAKQQFDTGLEMDLLQKYVFIPLDIFREKLHNRGIRSELDAWLTFLCEDEPEYIIKLIQQYPEFIPLYKDVYEMCRNTEKVMGLFSEELRMMDRNTVQFMIDEQETLLEKQREELTQTKGELTQTKGELDQAKGELSQTKGELDQAKGEISQKDELLAKQRAEIELLKQQLAEKEQK